MMTLAAFILSLAGFASLACAMSKHHQDLFGAMPGRWPVIALRGVGWLCLTGSLASAIAAAGPSVGIVLSFGIATLAALTVALLLTYRGTWWRL